MNVLTDIKIGFATGVSSFTAGLGHVLNIIPDNIGKLASLLGVVLTAILIFSHIVNGALQRKKLKLEIARLSQEVGTPPTENLDGVPDTID